MRARCSDVVVYGQSYIQLRHYTAHTMSSGNTTPDNRCSFTLLASRFASSQRQPDAADHTSQQYQMYKNEHIKSVGEHITFIRGHSSGSTSVRTTKDQVSSRYQSILASCLGSDKDRRSHPSKPDREEHRRLKRSCVDREKEKNREDKRSSPSSRQQPSEKIQSNQEEPVAGPAVTVNSKIREHLQGA